MHKLVAFGGCHVLSGNGNKLISDYHHIIVDKKIPCQLNSKTQKSIKVLSSYLEINKHNNVTIIFQTGNVGFTNSIGNLIGFGTGRKMVKSIMPITLTDNEFLQKTSVHSASMPGITTFLKQLLCVAIIPLNFIVINVLYVPRLILIKRVIKRYDNVTQVFALTPFCAFSNFHWIFRRYAGFVYQLIFKPVPNFELINMYHITKNENFFLDDKLHLNAAGYEVLNQTIANRLFN